MSAQAAAKKATNLSINAELLREAKALDINLSQAFEAHLAELVRAKKQKRWLDENREAINAYNGFVEGQGVFSEGWRSF
ncbi:MAG: type II toxin-antitoxin system CcdA family antitoxin [Candidatus Methylumidiphilus sp.]